MAILLQEQLLARAQTNSNHTLQNGLRHLLPSRLTPRHLDDCTAINTRSPSDPPHRNQMQRLGQCSGNHTPRPLKFIERTVRNTSAGQCVHPLPLVDLTARDAEVATGGTAGVDDKPANELRKKWFKHTASSASQTSPTFCWRPCRSLRMRQVHPPRKPRARSQRAQA